METRSSRSIPASVAFGKFRTTRGEVQSKLPKQSHTSKPMNQQANESTVPFVAEVRSLGCCWSVTTFGDGKLESSVHLHLADMAVLTGLPILRLADVKKSNA